ncbi:hypothetical protein ACKWTF_011574 [Chironomus riparius]
MKLIERFFARTLPMLLLIFCFSLFLWTKMVLRLLCLFFQFYIIAFACDKTSLRRKSNQCPHKIGLQLVTVFGLLSSNTRHRNLNLTLADSSLYDLMPQIPSCYDTTTRFAIFKSNLSQLKKSCVFKVQK